MSSNSLDLLRRAAAMLAAAAAVAGCGGGGSANPGDLPTSTPKGDPTTSTTTSAYGVLGTDTVRVVLVPAPGGVTPFLLEKMGDQAVTWGGPAAALGIPPTIPFSFTVSSCTVDSVDLKAACIGYGSSKIAVVDLARFATSLKVSDVGVQEFDSGAGTVPIVFSGASCVVCGVAADVGKHRFAIGGAGGFRVFNYGETAATARYDIPVGENFALLPQAAGQSYIIAPEYEPAGEKRKLRVVALDSGKVYTWNRNSDSIADLGPEGQDFIDSDVDAASVDLVTRSIVLSTEHSASFLVVDFGLAVLNDADASFSAPFAFARSNPQTAVRRLTDLAISTAGSMLLSHGEGDSNIGVTQLPTRSGFGGSAIGGLGVLDLSDPALDRTPCGANYVFIGKGDPHGLSLYGGIDNGQRGLVIDFYNRCAAIVDLAGLRDAPRRAADPNAIDTALLSVRSMVRFVPLQ